MLIYVYVHMYVSIYKYSMSENLNEIKFFETLKHWKMYKINKQTNIYYIMK